MKHKYFFISILAIALSILISCSRSNYSRSRSPILFNDDWQFILSADSTSVFREDKTLAWEQVKLPHTPRLEPLIVNDQWQGVCWYQKDFVLPALVKTQHFASLQYTLRFEGAMNVADVWVNGVHKTRHLGGYLPFVVDFTDVARIGDTNRVIVRLDNTDNPITGPKPLKDLDFNMYGGLYRDVFLVIENPVHITDPIQDNTPDAGIFVTYPEVSAEKAVIRVETHIRNTGAGDEKIEIRHRVIHDGVVVATSVETQNIASLQVATTTGTINLQSPKLWSPSAPNLYSLVTEVYTDGQLSDTDTTRIGIRRFEITKDRFAINGEEMYLRGVNRHQEYPFIGYALSNEAQYRDARKIKDAGFDYVRLSHYPHSPAFMDACDELGLLVLDAIPGWQYFNPDPAFQDQAIQTCRDMIRRDRNHPCVLAWEVSLNESWMPEDFIDRATAVAHEEHPGDQCFTAGWQKYGYDIYLQARQHRIEHYEDPAKPYIVSEYGDWEYYALNAGFAQNQWKDLLDEERTSRQLLGTGEKRLLQQATNIQEAHNDNFNTPAFADGYWVMYDYNRGYSPDLEASGIMSIFRVPKFSYYFFQSQRDPDEVSPDYASGPMVKIASYWDEKSSPDVRVFSNCEEVELLLNGDAISRQKPDTGRICDNLAHPPFTFRLDGFIQGTLVAKGYIGGEIVISDTVTTPGTPSALKLVIDESGRPPRAGVNDVIFVHAIIVDEYGNKVPVNDTEVKFSITGDAVVLNPERFALSEAGVATVLIKIGETVGEISVSAEAKGLAQSKIQLISL